MLKELCMDVAEKCLCAENFLKMTVVFTTTTSCNQSPRVPHVLIKEAVAALAKEMALIVKL